MDDDDSSTSSSSQQHKKSSKNGELGEIPEETKREATVKWSTRGSAAVSVINVPVALASGGVTTAVLPLAAAGGSIAMAPIADSNENELTDIKSMAEVHEKMRAEMDRMREENKRLRATIEKLEATVGSMEDTQDTLDAITKQQTLSIDEFEQQVEQQKALLREMQEDARAGMLQMLLTIIIASDADGDFKIDEEEIDPLIANIEGSGGLGVNAELFRKKVIETNGEIQAVLDMCSSILKDKGDDDVDDANGETKEGEDDDVGSNALKEERIFYLKK